MTHIAPTPAKIAAFTAGAADIVSGMILEWSKLLDDDEMQPALDGALQSIAIAIAAGAGADVAVEALGKVVAGIILADSHDKSAAAGYTSPPVPPGDPVGAIDGMLFCLATSRSVRTSPHETADAIERLAKIIRAHDAGAGNS